MIDLVKVLVASLGTAVVEGFFSSSGFLATALASSGFLGAGYLGVTASLGLSAGFAGAATFLASPTTAVGPPAFILSSMA